MGTDVWNTLAEVAIEAGLSEVPVAGGVLSGLVGAFWPSSSDPGAPPLDPDQIWDAIKDRVEATIGATINQAIQQNDYNLIIQNLAGLKGDMDNYIAEAKISSPNQSVITTYFVSTKQNFTLCAPNFQITGEELLLLPLFAKMAQMHITLLGDGVLFGKSWGWDAGTLEQANIDLQTAISTYTQYATDIYNNSFSFGQDPVAMPGWVTSHNTMVEEVMNYVYYWSYLDVTQYPPPVANLLRPPYEVFQGQVGGGPVSDPNYYNDYSVAGFSTYDLNDQGPISRVRVWMYEDFIAGFQVNYGLEIAPLMGPNLWLQGGAFSQGGPNYQFPPPLACNFWVDNWNPIVRVFGYAGDILEQIGFQLQDGTLLGPFGNGVTSLFDYTYPATNNENDLMVLSSMILNQGMSSAYLEDFGSCASGAIFGFRKLGSYTLSQMNQVNTLYTPALGTYFGTVSNYGNCRLDVTTIGESSDGPNAITGTFTNIFSRDFSGTLNYSTDQVQFTTGDGAGGTITFSGYIGYTYSTLSSGLEGLASVLINGTYTGTDTGNKVGSGTWQVASRQIASTDV